MQSNCRICGNELKTVLDLGEPYLSGFIKPTEQGVRFPLALGECLSCGLVQLRDVPDLDFLYKKQYWYQSGLNNSMVRDLQDVVNSIENRIQLSMGDVVVDIGCNDGTLLSLYNKELSLCRIGFDPAPNLVEKARSKGIYFINDYFTTDAYPYSEGSFERAKVVTTIAMFYDLPDPNSFVEEVKKILSPEGIWVVQLTDLYSMLKINAIDNICAEHLEYYRLKDLNSLMLNHGLEIFDVEYNKVNGGSIRIYVGYPGVHKVEESFFSALQKETEDFDFNVVSIETLKTNIYQFQDAILSFVKSFPENSVYALAASTKGNTLLQILGLSNMDIVAIGEVNKDKFGLVTVGSRIPIVPEKEVLEANPRLIIILAWHFVDTFRNLLQEYIKNGGMVLFPLPEPMILTADGGFYL